MLNCCWNLYFEQCCGGSDSSLSEIDVFCNVEVVQVFSKISVPRHAKMLSVYFHWILYNDI